MTEVLLVLSNIGFAVCILLYFYFREMRHREDFSNEKTEVFKFYKEGMAAVTEAIANQNKTVQETMNAYLKHIQALEKLAIPKEPTPPKVSPEMIESFLARSTPNEIEKTPEEEAQEDFLDVFNRIPVNHNTKVVVEDAIPNQIEEEIIE